MTLKECYAMMEGDYEGLLSRLMTEGLASKYVLKFLADDSLEKLEAAVKEADYKSSESIAHSLNGTAKYLGFLNLTHSTRTLINGVREGEYEQNPELLAGAYEKIKVDYVRVKEVVGIYAKILTD
ncbi:MAG: Hpt domain-containing protein [Lachnospiraceae bacterium]|nr:Hpt domain-containing protein [Lachnospiraceae bacterium]